MWSEHCQKTCNELDIECKLLSIGDSCPPGLSLESWARSRRYELIFSEMENNAVLLTAHHQNDQAETLLLQMIRGAGPAGLASMPTAKKFEDKWHLRPFLGHTRAVLNDYAQQNKLVWIEDDSNQNSRHDRNYLRNEIFPQLTQRWPGILGTLSRVASHQAEVSQVLAELGQSDLNACVDGIGHKLLIEKLLEFDYARRSNILRCWLADHDIKVPDAVTIHRIQSELLNEAAASQSMLEWAGYEIHGYKGMLYLIPENTIANPNKPVYWDLNTVLVQDGESLSAVLTKGRGLKKELIAGNKLEVRYRRGGEKIQLPGKNHRQSIKKLFQEKEIPSFIRKRVPFLYLDDKLIAVAGFFIDKDVASENDETSWQVCWSALAKYSLQKTNVDDS